jgi:hypothetical protein
MHVWMGALIADSHAHNASAHASGAATRPHRRGPATAGASRALRPRSRRARCAHVIRLPATVAPPRACKYAFCAAFQPAEVLLETECEARASCTACMLAGDDGTANIAWKRAKLIRELNRRKIHSFASTRSWPLAGMLSSHGHAVRNVPRSLRSCRASDISRIYKLLSAGTLRPLSPEQEENTPHDREFVRLCAHARLMPVHVHEPPSAAMAQAVGSLALS